MATPTHPLLSRRAAPAVARTRPPRASRAPALSALSGGRHEAEARERRAGRGGAPWQEAALIDVFARRLHFPPPVGRWQYGVHRGADVRSTGIIQRSRSQDSTMISTPARNQQSPQSSLAGWPLAQQRFQRASRAARDSLAGRSLQRPSLASGPRAPAPAGVRPPETLPPLRPGAPARAWRVLRSAPRHPRESCGQSSYCWPQAQQLAAAAGTPQTRHRRRRHTSLGTALSRREARGGSCESTRRQTQRTRDF